MATGTSIRESNVAGDPMLHLVDVAAAGLLLHLVIKDEDLPFQICKMGSGLIVIEGLADCIEQEFDPAEPNQPA